MARRQTRSKGAPSKPSSPPPETQSKPLPPADEKPPQLIVLPRGVSENARIVSLQHPRNLQLSRYLWCPEAGLFELVKSSPPRGSPRSWLLAQTLDKGDNDEPPDAPRVQAEKLDESLNGYLLQDASLLMATPFDPVFLLQPLIDVDKSKNRARMEDDYFERLGQTSKHMKFLLMRDSFRQLLVQRLGAISETMNVMDDKLYKPDPLLLLQEIVAKARRATHQSVWPRSLELAKVTKGLQVPLTVQAQIEREEKARESQQENAVPTDTDIIEHYKTQDTGSMKEPAASTSVTELMRLRVCMDYIMSAYVRKELHEDFNTTLATNRIVDFLELNEHLSEVKKAQEEVKALKSISDNISRKRSDPDDDEAAELRAEKRRKKEEDEQKKKSESRALKDLKKVDTTGMKKMSAFFTPKSKA